MHGWHTREGRHVVGFSVKRGGRWGLGHISEGCDIWMAAAMCQWGMRAARTQWRQHGWAMGVVRARGHVGVG